MVPKINVLSKEVAELIAAGEVVERPASVVKELVENAIDAGADSVTVEIRSGGIAYIRVTDNGSGIESRDVRTAFISHATSKLKQADDLNAIFTLGFRGEALPSIACVSRLQMLTKTKDESFGIRYETEGGTEIAFEQAGCPNGTTVTVRDLFYNVPARLKFLRRDVTEGTYVSDTFIKLALAHPEVSLSLIKDGKKTLASPGNGELYSAVYALFGKETAESLLKCRNEIDGITVDGYISQPLSNRPNRNMQYYFVNGRSVRLPAAVPALDEAYKNSIMVGKFPMCFLNVHIPAGKIDVNVHPAKSEIRFSEETKIYEAVYYAARSALSKGDTARPNLHLQKKDILQKAVPAYTQMKMEPMKRFSVSTQQEEKPSAPNNPTVSEKSADAKSEFEKSTDIKPLFAQSADTKSAIDKSTDAKPFSANITPENLLFRDTSGLKMNTEPCPENTPTGYRVPWQTSPQKPNIDIGVSESEDISPKVSFTQKFLQTEEKKEVPELNKSVRVLGEVFNTYIIAEQGDKLLMIDKHAAHERMIFNELTANTDVGAVQYLLQPVYVNLTPKEYIAVKQNTEVFRRAGFQLEDFGDNCVVVRGTPSLLTGEDVTSLVTELAGKLQKGEKTPLPEKLDWLFHSAACRSAVKAGDTLQPEEMQHFVETLLQDNAIRYCPHGRPVLYELTKYEIEKQFGRLG